MGRHVVVNGDDIADEAGAERLIESALDEFGRIDVLVNNAGILRDRMLVNMTFAEWDEVIRVHLRGTFGPSHVAARHWRERAKAGEEVDARIINTTSPSGIYGNVGQANYGAAKPASPRSRSSHPWARPVRGHGQRDRPGRGDADDDPAASGHARSSAPPPDAFDPSAPENIAPIVVWLGSRESAGITGRVFNVRGGRISVAEGWRSGPSEERDRRWDPAELGDVIPALVAEAQPNANMRGVADRTGTALVKFRRQGRDRSRPSSSPPEGAVG